jgi:hypothetical protein
VSRSTPPSSSGTVAERLDSALELTCAALVELELIAGLCRTVRDPQALKRVATRAEEQLREAISVLKVVRDSERTKFVVGFVLPRPRPRRPAQASPRRTA